MWVEHCKVYINVGQVNKDWYTTELCPCGNPGMKVMDLLTLCLDCPNAKKEEK